MSYNKCPTVKNLWSHYIFDDHPLKIQQTLKYKGYLLRQVIFRFTDVALLKVEREMWKSVDFMENCRFGQNLWILWIFKKELMFPPWILTVE